MFTDMVGYTAATQLDEGAALGLRREQEALIRPLISKHQGRKVKSTGDGLLVEFDSSLQATECAISIQRKLHHRNDGSGGNPIDVRIGIHLGDVERQGADIFGDAVNIASRIQPMAEPGGICVSNAVHEQVWNKISEKLEKLAPTSLKGIRMPMDLYRVVLPWTGLPIRSGRPEAAGIAVLPFTNISPDPKDEYFADGLTEELITVLSQLPELPVIARTSVMQYKSTTKPVSQIGTELGVATLLEGSVRKAGNRLRVTAQLIDTATQRHLWANSYDRELDDVFAVQTEIARQVSDALKIELRPAQAARLESRSAVKPDSYLAYLKGRTLLAYAEQSSMKEARVQFELATRLDPQNAAAFAGLASVIRRAGWFYERRPREEWDAEGRRAAARALELDPDLSEAHSTQAMILWDDFDYPATERELQRAISLNPSNAEARFVYALVLEDLGRAEEALTQYRLAEAADPLGREALHFHARLLVWLARYDEALSVIEKHRLVTGGSVGTHELLSDYYRARGDLQRSLEELDVVIREQQGGGGPQDWNELTVAWRHILTGDKEAARRILRKLEASPPGPLTMAFVGWWYAELGDADACFRCWQRSARDRSLPAQALVLDPQLDHIRKDPRFRALLHEIGLA